MTIIRDGSTPQQWCYVNREDNPADHGSKGLKLDVLIKNDRWLTGPKFLWKEEECWPAMVEIPILKDDDPEVRKESQIYVASARHDVMEELMTYYSSWWKLKLAVSWLLRYKRHLKNKILQRRESSLTMQELEQRSGYLTLDKLREAENEILCCVQKKEFPKAIASQSEEDQRSVKTLMKKMGASISKLNPQVHNGSLQVGGRIEQARVLRLEAPSNFALQTPRHRPDNQGPPPESGAHGPRVSFVVVKTEVLDLERKICSAPSAEQMF